MRIGGVVRRVAPQMLAAPVERGRRRRLEPRGNLVFRRPRRNVHRERAVLFWIQHDQLPVTGGDRIHRPTPVHGRVVPVGGDLIVHERVVVSHVPERHDHIPLDASRPRGRRRHFTVGDAIGPIRQDAERARGPHRAQRPVHGSAANAALQTPVPGFRRCLDGRICLVDVVQRAGELIPELVTEVASRLERVDPVVPGQHRWTESIALHAGAGKRRGGRRRHERQPVVAGIDPGGLAWCGRRRHPQRHGTCARLQSRPGRVHQPVAPDPDAVARRRQFRDDEPPLVVGDDDLDELSRELVCFSDDPDSGLGTLRPLDHAADGSRRLRLHDCGEP
jgi:hypothetical protein